MSYKDKLKPLATSTPSYAAKLKPLGVSQSQPKTDTRDFLQKASDFATGHNLPGAQLGKALGNSLGGIAQAVKQRSFQPLLDAGKQNNAMMGRIVGDTVQSAALPTSLALGAPASLLGRVGQSTATGATLLGAGSAAKGDSAKDVALNAALGAGVGAALPVAAAGASAVGRQIFDKLPQRIIQSVLGQSKQQLLGNKDVSSYMLQQQRVGTPDKLITDSQSAIEQLSKTVQHAIEKVAPKTTRILRNEPVSVVVREINSKGGAITPKEVTEIVERLAPQAKGLLEKQSLSLPEANQLRAALDRTLGDKGFLTSQLPFNKEVLRAYTNSLRSQVQSLAPAGTREAFAQLSKEITLRDSLLSRFAVQNRNLPINAFDLILAGGGFAGAGPLGAVGTFAAKKAVQSVSGRTGAAVLLDTAGRLGKPAVQAVSPAVTPAVVEAVGALSPFGGKPTQ